MAERECLHVFAYDISSDRFRTRAARILEDYGTRVQASVFEIRVSRQGAHHIAHLLSPLIEPGDSLRVYVIDEASREASFNLGGAPISEAQDFWIF